jgi:hypothetical protein
LTERLRNPGVAGWLLMAGAIGVAAGLVFWLERGLTYGWDEFVWLELAGLAPDTSFFFRPYGGHLIATPYFLWRGMLELFGASFTAFSVVQVAGLSLLAALLYVYSKRRLGPILALAPAITMLFLGSAWPVLLEPMIGIQFLAALVPGLAAILMLERGSRPGDAAACGLLCLALAGFSQALPFLTGAVVAVVLSPNRTRRIWVVAIPIIAYGLWRMWAAKYEPTGIIYSNVPFLPAYFADALAVYTSAIFGLANLVGAGPWSQIRLQGFSLRFLSAGVVFTAIELLAIAGTLWLLLRRRKPIPRTFWPPLAILAVFWVELGIVLIPGRTAAEPRYLYAGVLTLLLVIVEMLRGAKTTRLTVAVAVVLTGAAVAGNLARFQEGRQVLDAIQKEARADMTVIELAGLNGDQAFTPNLSAPNLVPAALILNSGPWLEVVDRYGSAANSIPELQAQSKEVREQADAIAVKILRLHPRPTAGPARRCQRIGGNAAPTEIALPRGGAVLKPTRDSTVALRRWADEYAAGLGNVRSGQPVILAIPGDPSDVPWRLSFDRGGPVEVCAIGRDRADGPRS